MDEQTQPRGGRAEKNLDDLDVFRLMVESVQDYAIFMLDPTGHVLTWNTGAERIKGYRPEEIIGQHFSRFYAREAVESGWPGHELKMAGEIGRFEDEGWRVRKDGSVFWANVILTALHGPDGSLIGFSKVTRDLTQRRAHEESLRQTEERFRLLVEGVNDYAIFMLDANGHVTTWNAGAQRIKGYRPGEIIGQHFSRFYPADAIASGWPEHELKMAAEKGRFVDEGWRLRKDGSRFWANVTITALRDEQGRLRGFAKLTRDLTERQRVEALEVSGARRDEMLEAERNARMDAQKAVRIKDEFLATLSHELRTPLNAILGWAQVLRAKSTPSAEELRRALEVIDRNARSQAQMIEDLLDLSRIMAGRIRLDVQQVALMEVVRSAVDSLEPTAHAKGVRLESVLDPRGGTVSGDPGRLQQVIWNLVSNAIKFTPKGGRIEVLLQRVNSHIELSVSDSGIGIPASFLPQVFDRFSQKESSTTRQYGGLGLGLAICKQLVELHGGRIVAKSPGEGMGSTFSVTLPLTIVPADKTRGVHPAHAGMPEPTALPDLKGICVLVVEDEPDALDLVQRMLESLGASVKAADSADSAMQLLKAMQPDAIVSDIGMPGTDGYQFMRSLRAGEPRERRVPALALTAFARPDDRKQAILSGYQAHLSKPFDLGELAIIVAGLVGRV